MVYSTWMADNPYVIRLTGADKIQAREVLSAIPPVGIKFERSPGLPATEDTHRLAAAHLFSNHKNPVFADITQNKTSYGWPSSRNLYSWVSCWKICKT